MNRRFLGILFLALAGVSLGANRSARPNIVFIFSDDHAYQAISAYRDPRGLIDTPHLDRIAREGVRFDRCLVPNSICGPSRASVLTGVYSHINGYYNNASDARFDGSQITLPKLLRAGGYQTAIVGKWHLNSEPTGFDFWHILPGQGEYYHPPMIRNGEPVEERGHVTDVITERSLEWLEQRDREKPFLLMIQHKAPHRHWEPALRHLGHDGDRRYDEPATFFDDYAGRGTAEREQDMEIASMSDRDLKLEPPPRLTPEERKKWDAYYGPRNEAFRKAQLQGRDLVRWKYNRYLHDYLGCIRGIDESVGRVLAYLDEHGLSENTIVVYSSDQGFFLGEHGWFDKRWIFEESLRTPLLVRWPGVVTPGQSSDAIVSNVDFAPTFLAAAGLPIPGAMQGRSFLPLLRGEQPKDWRKSFYYHYYEYPQPHRVMPHYGVVTERYKLVHFYGPNVKSYWELFDLQNDPQELTSVYGELEYADTQRELHAELQRLRRELKVPEETPAEAFGN